MTGASIGRAYSSAIAIIPPGKCRCCSPSAMVFEHLCEASHKCSKTSVVANLGIGLALKGKKVCLIDADPQGSLTASLGYQEPDEIRYTLANIMMNIINEEEYDPKEGILHHEEGVDLVLANIELSGLEVSLSNVMSREMILKEYVEQIRDEYSFLLWKGFEDLLRIILFSQKPIKTKVKYRNTGKSQTQYYHLLTNIVRWILLIQSDRPNCIILIKNIANMKVCVHSAIRRLLDSLQQVIPKLKKVLTVWPIGVL